MAERRTLVANLKPAGAADPDLERQFVYGDKSEPSKPTRHPTPQVAETRELNGASPVGRVPLTTRVRTDYGAALKRASLERQLSGQLPNTVQDILEDALGPWLRSNGYIQ
jgi:hypothetical protein